MTCLEPLDAKILKELLADGRKSFVSLAQDLEVTKDVITQHYNKLKKQGIIAGSTIQFNYKHFGYEAVATILANANSKNYEHILESLGKIPGIFPRREYISNHNIRIITTLKTLSELGDLKNRIKQHNGLNALNTFIWTDVRNNPENLKLNNSDQKCSVHAIPVYIHKNSADIDSLDLSIIKELESDSRISFSEISKKLGIAVDTVSRRYSKLKENGTIKACVQISPLSIGYVAIAEYYISLQSFEGIEAAVNDLSSLPDVSYIAKTTGNYDLIVAALVKDLDQVVKIRDKIFNISTIERTEVTLIKAMPKWPTKLQYISTF